MIEAKRVFLLLLAFLAPLPSHGVTSPFEIDLKELERAGSATAPKPEGEKGRSERRSGKRNERISHRAQGGRDGHLRYTVQPGDHLFKILTGRIGMSNEAAERLIPDIIRINRIGDIKNLTVGGTLLIPNRKMRGVVAHREEAAKIPTTARPSETRDMATPSPRHVDVPPAPSTPPPAFAGRSAKARSPARGGGANASATPATAPAMPSTDATPTTAAAMPPASPPKTPLSSGAPSAAPVATTWICPVPERDPAAAIDSLLSLLEAAVSRGKTLEAGQGTETSVSVQVERYFEYKGGRYVVSIGESDPGRYTLLRILETAGYKVLRLDGREDFRGSGEKLLRLVGVEPDFGRQPLQQEKGVTGFLIRQEGTLGRRVVVSAEQPGPGDRWVLAPECGAR